MLATSTSLQWGQAFLLSNWSSWMNLHAIGLPHAGNVLGHLLATVLGGMITLFEGNGEPSPVPHSILYSFISRYSILPAMSLDGVLHLAIQDCPYTAVQFNSFIEALLDNMNPFPQPNSVIVMDNASIHKSQELLQMVEER